VHTCTTPRFSLTIPDDLNEWLEEQMGEDPSASKSGAAREPLQRARELDDVDAELEALLDAREQVEEQRESANAPFFVRWYRWFRDDDTDE
jgi:Arc/MetJ-type ribon-helix-helix transcriptional regulator